MGTSESKRIVVAAFCSALALVAVGCRPAPARASGDTTMTVESEGMSRQYVIHRPAHAPAGPLPAVLIFHGGGGTPESMVTATHFDTLADAQGFLAVYPAGADRSWNDGRGADTKAGAAGHDDIAFVSTLIDHLVANDGVDAARVYATGISNGGMLTEDLGCRLAGKLAAIAPVSGPLPAADESDCTPAYPLPVLEIHGTADPIVSYTGGPVRVTSGHHGGPGTSAVLSVADTQDFWRTRESCGPVTTTALPHQADDGTSVNVETSTCAAGSKVELYSVTGGGHTWPGGPQYLPKAVVGPVSHQFDATQVIWQFFSAFHR
ncbi:extracellular catalytic domain type 1 short-chain-length polyhydroxyalkanoate depolymerase [Nocardia sp. NBC_01327]|uniref:extracellular catalytic domain type 1 short-chain-length polyhydroxyalkanoate depolymerase n=1 Tax=Nocardia sp. NBC_01327 TaxID=2903593 RepID=UPI002E108875|nr:esterase [Nocardia sp. NBC_01327]